MAKDFFEAYVACLLMFLIPVAIMAISRIRDFIGNNRNKKAMAIRKESDKELIKSVISARESS